MHERMRGADPGITTVIFNKDHPLDRPLVGRVYARGTADELTDAEYLLIEARDGEIADERAIGSAEELGRILDAMFNVTLPAPVEEVFARIGG